MKLVNEKLQVLHFPQVPCEPFRVDVKDEIEAMKIIDVLAKQHLFLFEKKFIPDYANVITVVMWSKDCDDLGNPDWTEYWNEDEGMEWDEFVQAYLKEQEHG